MLERTYHARSLLHVILLLHHAGLVWLLKAFMFMLVAKEPHRFYYTFPSTRDSYLRIRIRIHRLWSAKVLVPQDGVAIPYQAPCLLFPSPFAECVSPPGLLLPVAPEIPIEPAIVRCGANPCSLYVRLRGPPTGRAAGPVSWLWYSTILYSDCSQFYLCWLPEPRICLSGCMGQGNRDRIRHPWPSSQLPFVAAC